jgi:hypothetical protein
VLQVREDLTRLIDDVALYELAAGRIDGDLAGAEHPPVRDDRLRVRSDGFRSFGGRDGVAHRRELS